MKTAFAKIIVLFMLFLLSPCKSSFVDHISRSRALNFWELTRNCNIVLSGTVTHMDENVTLSVSSVYKGDNIPDIISFLTPASQSNIKKNEAFIRFSIKEKCIVFLNREDSGKYRPLETATGNIEFINLIEQVIQDVLKLDSLISDIDKCKMLISLMSPYQDIRSFHAYNELYQKYNKEEFFEFFEPLDNEPKIQTLYISLLEKNPHPSTVKKLRALLQKNPEDHIISQVISSLRSKEIGNTELSEEILKYVSHDNSNVCRQAIFVLGYRGFSDALPEVAKRLNDSDPMVRSSVLNFIGHFVQESQITAKVKKMTHDKNEDVRAEAYRVLGQDTSKIKGLLFYKFLFSSLFDRSEQVRRASARLDIMPVRSSLLLLWPSFILIGFIFYRHRNIQWLYRLKILLIGIITGYISSAAAGYFVGSYHTDNPFFHSLILIPPLFIPVGIMFSEIIIKLGIKKAVAAFSLLTVLMCVIIFLITLNNTLWPCLIIVFFILVLTNIPFQKSYIKIHKLILPS